MDDETAETLRELAARRDLLALCARILSEEAEVALFDAVISEALEAVSDAVGTPLLEPDLLGEGRGRSLEALSEEYCRLFVGPHPVCSPYASAQAGEALLGGRARERLLAFAQRQELELQPESARVASPDHVGLSLGLLSNLYDRAVEALPHDPAAHAAALSAAEELLQEHLRPWVPRLLRRVEAETHRGLYRATARLGLALLSPEGDLA